MSSTKSNATTTEAASVKELRSLIAEAEKALSAAGEQTSEEVENLGRKFKDALTQGRHAGDRAIKVIREQAEHADEFVHDKPYVAIGVAAGLGLLAGALISRRCHC